MRLFEIISIISVLSVYLIRLVRRIKNAKVLLVFPIANIFIILLHLIIDGLFIQMLLLYIMSVGMLLIDVIKIVRKKEYDRKFGFGRIIGTSAISIFLLIAIALPLILQVPPEPTGPYSVENVTFEWVDQSRYETFSADDKDYRDLAVTVWYPSSNKTITEDLGGTESKVNQISDAQAKYPVLIFSHGFGMNVGSYGVLLGEIASHGYIIFAIDHPYEASSVLYPDGRLVGMSTEVIKSLNSDKQKRANQLIQQYIAETVPEKKDQIFIEYDELSDQITGNSMKIWTDDTIFVLNKVEELSETESSELFTGHLDMNNIGVFGHSFGGTIGSLACLYDKRIDAGISLDGFQFGQIRHSQEGSITQPFMEMTSEDAIPGINDYIYSRTDNVMYRLHINGSRHNNFSDIAMYMPLLRETSSIACGSINPTRMNKIVSDYCLTFFDCYLKGQEASILENTAAYPEIELKKE